MKLKLTSWSEEDVDRLKTLIAAGASAQRVSVALRRSLLATKLKARDIGLPFPSERALRAKRRSILQKSVDAPRTFTRASGNRYE